MPDLGTKNFLTMEDSPCYSFEELLQKVNTFQNRLTFQINVSSISLILQVNVFRAGDVNIRLLTFKNKVHHLVVQIDLTASFDSDNLSGTTFDQAILDTAASALNMSFETFKEKSLDLKKDGHAAKLQGKDDMLSCGDNSRVIQTILALIQ